MIPLRGVVLAGGFSRRMGRDKASLSVDGRTLLERTVGLLHSLGLPVTVSARREQTLAGSGFERVDDPDPSIGPAGGLLEVMDAHPGSTLLVLAVDLPRLCPGTLRTLIGQRDPAALVTAFRNPGDQRLDPLCALYEPTARSVLRAGVTAGEFSLRRMLEMTGRVHLLALARPDALADLDTPGALANLTLRFDTRPPMPSIQISVRYFALLREQRGLSTESVRTDCTSAGALYDELRRAHGLSLPPESLKVAINDEFTAWSTPLKDGDTLVFLPPMAGG